MRLIARAEVGVAPLLGRLNFPAHSLTVIAKVTVALEHGGVARVVRDDERSLPTGDIPYDGNTLGPAVPRYASDFAYHKPAADVLVAGHFYAPGGKPVRVGEAVVQVEDREVRVAVVGRRLWPGKGPLPEAQRAEPFEKLELRWEHAFGGEGNGLNPVGTGYIVPGLASSLRAEPRELPRIERFERPVSSLDDPGAPICFGPRSVAWPVRMQLIGTCDDAWLKHRWPWFPKDFDMRHFQAAIPELQVRDYLRGNEKLTLKNMHPDLPLFETRLPGLVGMAAIQRKAADGRSLLSEAVTMNLDTLFVDMDALCAQLVWRGHCTIADGDASDVAFVWADVQALAAAPSAADVCSQAEAAIRDWHAQWDFSPAEPEPTPVAPQEPSPPKPPSEPVLDVELAALLAALPAAAEPIPLPTLSAEQQAALDAASARASAEVEALADVATQPQPQRPAWTRERVEETRDRKQPLAGLDLSGVDLSGIDLSGANLAGTLFRRARLDGARLSSALLKGASFEEASIQDIDLRDAVLDGADLSRSRGERTHFEGAQLLAANLSGANLPGACFDRANLELVHAPTAMFDGSTFAEACVREATFEKSSLVNAQFSTVDGQGARFNEAVLHGARFTGSKLNEADFSSATLEQAEFTGCTLDDMMIEEAKASGLRLSKCSAARLRASSANVSGGLFKQVEGQDIVMDHANLTGATLHVCVMPGVDLTEATLTYGRLLGCTLRNAKFVKAILEGAALLGCDCLESSFEGAQLERCDGSGSSFFRSEFLDANVTHFHGKQRDLGQTKLSPSA